MAYRDLTSRFAQRRTNLRKRNLRFQLRPTLDKSALGALFLKQVGTGEIDDGEAVADRVL